MSETPPSIGEQKASPPAGARIAKGLIRNFLAPVAVVALLLAALKFTGLVDIAGFSRKNEAAVARLRLQEIGELATQAAYFTGIDTIDDNRVVRLIGKEINVPFTNTKIIYSYDGVIKAGMDFSGIDFTVDEANKVIRVTLPEAHILSNEIDSNSLKVYDEKHSAFTLIRVERFGESIAALKAEAEKNAISKGLLTEARRNAETLLSGFLSAGFDMNEYSLQFADRERSGEP